MQLGKQMIIIKKLETNVLDNGNIVTKDFDVNEIVLNNSAGYWFNKEESKIEFDGKNINLILVFQKKQEDTKPSRNIDDILPTYKI